MKEIRKDDGSVTFTATNGSQATVFIDPDDSTGWMSILWVMGPDGKFENDHTIYGDTFEECARVAKSFIQGESKIKEALNK